MTVLMEPLSRALVPQPAAVGDLALTVPTRKVRSSPDGDDRFAGSTQALKPESNDRPVLVRCSAMCDARRGDKV